MTTDVLKVLAGATTTRPVGGLATDRVNVSADYRAATAVAGGPAVLVAVAVPADGGKAGPVLLPADVVRALAGGGAVEVLTDGAVEVDGVRVEGVPGTAIDPGLVVRPGRRAGSVRLKELARACRVLAKLLGPDAVVRLDADADGRGTVSLAGRRRDVRARAAVRGNLTPSA